MSVINGDVTDASGAAIPNAKLTIVNLASQVKITVNTDRGGRYSSVPLKPGRYRVSAEAPKFQTVAATVVVEIGQAGVANLSLPVAGSQQTVTVTTGVPQIATESNSVGVIRDANEVATLPINQRNSVRIIELTPGTAPVNTQAQSTGVSNYRGTALATVNGSSYTLTNYLIDGINNNDNHGGAATILYPLIDSIAEMRVFNTGTDAQFGRSLGGVVDVVLKSGGKQFHGSAFEYARNSVLDAKNFFTPANSPQTFSMHQFGGSFSGPLFISHVYSTNHNKTFFFGDFEGVRRNQTLVNVSTLPLPALVKGDFSSLSTQIFDPLNGQPFPGNVIPQNRINFAGGNVANLYPTPNQPGSANNYVYTPQRIFDLNDGDLKIDHYASEKLWFALRLSGGMLNGLEPSQLPAPAIGAGPSYPGPQQQPHFQGDASVTKVFGMHVINDFLAGYSRLAQRSTQTLLGQDIATQLGIPNINVAGDSSTSGGVSYLIISGYQTLGDAPYTPGDVVSDSNQLGDTLTIDHGHHIIKAGFEFQRRRYNIFQPDYPRGEFVFAPYFTRNPQTGLEGNALADLLLGLPESSRLDLQNGTRGIRRSEYSAFVQDSWKVNKQLTFNLGLRYDFYDNKTGTEVQNRMANFLPSLGQLVTVGTPQLPSHSGTDNSHLNFSPRVGFAYSPHSTFVLRGSYGIYFAPMYVVLSEGIAFNPPFIGSETYTNSPANVAGARTLSQGFTRQFAANGYGGTLNAIATHLPTPYASLWDLGFEKQLPAKFVLAADYVGNKGTHLALMNDINTPTPGPGSPTTRRPFPNFTDIYLTSSSAYSNYNAVQLTLSRRFSSDLQLSESYTHSHCLDVEGQPQNPADIPGDYGNCGQDLRNRSVTTASYNMPFGHNKALFNQGGPFTDKIITGWTLNLIGNFYSGFPFTPTYAANTTNSSGITQRPNLIPGCDLYQGARTLTRWFNTSCFAAPALYTFGNAGRAILVGPRTNYVDMSLFKTFNLSQDGHVYAQFQAQVFNITNTPQLNNPGASIGTATAGVISSAGSDATFARTAREIQLGVRFEF